MDGKDAGKVVKDDEPDFYEQGGIGGWNTDEEKTLKSNNFVNTIILCAMIFAQIYSNSQFTRKTILQ